MLAYTKTVRSLFYLWILCSTKALISLPKGHDVASGTATFEGGNTQHLQITTSDKAIINYDSFNIGLQERVTFIQPSEHSTVLNRVRSSDAAHLMGRLSSNGKVFLINQGGIIIGPHSTINTGSFIASTLDIANEDFLSDRFIFTLKPGTENSSIVNFGTLSSPEGAIALLAPHIRNEGAISTQAGKVLLTGGEKITLDFAGDGLMSFSIEGAVKDAVITHLGTIDAAGGEVFLSMKVADAAIQKIVNTDGIDIATHMVEENGVIQLVPKSLISAKTIALHGGGASKIEVQGKLDVSQPTFGGAVEIFGDTIILEGATILAQGALGGGTILVGGDDHGKGSMQKSTLTYMDPASSIHTDALTQGDGGKVILWSDERTYFYGNISSCGGAEDGNGGFVETSGKQGLSVAQAQVNALAPHGKTGQWLMDPDHIIVAEGGSATLADVLCGAHPGTTQTIDPATINAAGADVVLCAEIDITVLNEINIAMAGIGITFQDAAVDGAETIFLNENVITNGGLIQFKGPVILGTGAVGSNVTVDATSGGTTPTGNDVKFTTPGTINGTVPGEQSLNVLAGTSGNILILGDIGRSTPINALALTGVTVQIASIGSFGAPGAISSVITGTTGSPSFGIFLNAPFYHTTGSQTYNGLLQLTSGITSQILTIDSPVSFDAGIDGIMNGAQDLFIDTGGGSINIVGSIGNRINLGEITLHGLGGITLAGDLFTNTIHGHTGNITLNSTAGISMGGSATLAGGTSGAFLATGNVTLPNATTISTQHNSTTFSSNIDGPGSLTALADDNFISIESIGATTSLSSLTVTRTNTAPITIGNVGNTGIGVTGSMTLTAGIGPINFTGTNYFANAQTYFSPSNAFFHITQTGTTTFTSHSGDIKFGTPTVMGTGIVNIGAPTSSLVVNTVNNDNININQITGPATVNSLLINAGSRFNPTSGTVILGDGPTFTDITVNAGTIFLFGAMNADSITLVSLNGVTNFSAPVTLTALNTLLIDALNGTVGTPGSPIDIAAPGGIATVGTSGNAILTGITGDRVIHCLPNNIPTLMSFNGMIGCSSSPTPCPPCPTPAVPGNLPAAQFLAPGSTSIFTNYLGSDFYFLEDRAAGCDGIYVHQNWQPVEERCLYNHTFWINSTRIEPFLLKNEESTAPTEITATPEKTAPSRGFLPSLKNTWNQIISKIKASSLFSK